MRDKWFVLVRNKLTNFQIFELGNSLAFYYLLVFYLRPALVFLGLPNKFPLTPYHIDYLAIGYLTLGLIFFLLGYYNKNSASFAGKIPDILSRGWDFSRALFTFGALFAAGLGIKLLRIFEGAYSSGNRSSFFVNNSFSSFIGFLDWLGYIALIIAFISYFNLKKNNDPRYKLWRLFAWGAFAVEILYALPSCVRTSVIVPVLLYLLVRFFLVKIDYKIVVLCGLGIALFLFPLGNLCRNPQVVQVYNRVQSGASSERLTVARAVPFTSFFIAESFLSRIDQSNVFAAIIEHPQPLLYGKPLLNFFVSLGPPRFLWQNKPIITADGNEFGRRIGVLADVNFATFVGPTMVGDLYINFGIIGIILGMFFLGFLFRFIFDYLIRRTGASLSGLLIYGIAWIQIMKGFEDSIAPVFAGLVKVSALLLVIALFLQGDLALIWQRLRRWIMMRT